MMIGSMCIFYNKIWNYFQSFVPNYRSLVNRPHGIFFAMSLT